MMVYIYLSFFAVQITKFDMTLQGKDTEEAEVGEWFIYHAQCCKQKIRCIGENECQIMQHNNISAPCQKSKLE